MKKKAVLIMLAASMLATPLTMSAEEESKYAYLEDMSVKELKELDAAIHELLGDTTEAESEEVIESEAETEEESVHMTEEEFLNDIVESYNARSKVADSVSVSEQNSMTTEEGVKHLQNCVLAEKPFYDKYKNAIFDDLNIQYLCSRYISGIKKQMDSCTTYFEDKDDVKLNDTWDSGYYNRAYVIVELSDYWDLPFGDVSSMRENTAYLDSLDEAETRNAQVPKETVKEVQTLLHEIGFKCWNIDGVAGKRTVKAIKRFQEMYGYTVDGMISDELIEQLKQVKVEKGLNNEVETEIETEVETES